ncbi:hypothetical protein SH2C18_22340 [Clostridium sediminicola]|uniref:sensor histidine kinase n=1 Tax=Clostridium sediminicola TaxID=3114879 RepID=UPI0031F27CD9
MNIKITFYKFTFAFIFIFLVVIGISNNVCAEEIYKKNILILDSNHDGYKISNDFILGTKFIFKKDEEVPDFILEHMDSKRFSEKEYFESLKEMYSTKYKDKKIDLIVSIDEPAFEFLEKYHEELFKDVPVVATAVNYFDTKRIEENEEFTGILQNIEIKPTIDIALELQPKTKKIQFIMDKTSINPYYRKLADDVMKNFQGKLKYSIFETSTLTELEEEFNKLESEDGTIVFMFPTYFEDHGKYISWDHGIQSIIENSNVPVYTSWAIYLSKGIVGGKLSFAFFNASEASNLVKEVLAGTPPSQLKIKESKTAKYNFNYPVLVEKFGLDISKIPENSKVSGEPDTKVHIEKKNLYEYFVILIVFLILLIIYLLANILRRKKAEKGLKDAEKRKILLKQMEKYEKLRSEFFANISHELRTPINVITSALQYIDMVYENGKFEENKDKVFRYRDSMYQNCYRLLRLINNLIDITKIDSGYLEISKHNYNIVNVVEEVTMSVFSLVESKGINLVFDTDFEEKIMAIDPDMIERIVLNLLSNAVKFTDKGGTITVFMHDKGDEIEISVKDSGIGIPKEKLNLVFQRFVQVEETLERNKEGSGIGLSLVKSLVNLHNGEIRVESEFNNGADFIVQLPVLINDGEECADISFVKELNTEKVNIEFSEV